MEKLFQRKRRRESSLWLFLLLVLIISSCKENSPTTYTSIKGTWNCSETSFQRNIKYSVDIYKSKSGDANYLISNFHNDGYENIFVNTQLIGDSIFINNQSLNQQGLIVKSGSGIVNANFTKIYLNYIIYNGTTDLEVSATYYR
jgi:hypothetical protein